MQSNLNVQEHLNILLLLCSLFFLLFCLVLFHKEEGISFVNYLNRERLSRARALLKTTNLKVFEISDNVGFNNVKHFNYLFKQYTGITPLEYRNR